MARKLVVEIIGDASSLGRSYAAAEKGTKRFGREMEHAGRGAAVATVGVRSLGRALGTLGAATLGGFAAADVLRSVVDAGTEAAASQRQLAAQLKATGLSFQANRGAIEETAAHLASLSGFTRDELVQSFTTLVRSTRSVQPALKDMGIAADVARGTHKSLTVVTLALAKAAAGSTTSLKRLGIELPKGTTGVQGIAIAAERFAGQAKAGSTAQQKFASTLRTSEEIIGLALLPTLNKYLGELTVWLDKMNRSGRLQRDVNEAVKIATQVFQGLKAVVVPTAAAFAAVGKAVGGTKNEVELMLPTLLLLRKRLLRLSANPYVITVTLVAIGAEEVAAKIKGLQQMALNAQAAPLIKGSGVETTLVPALAKQIEALRRSGVGTRDILARLRKQLGGSLKADDLIAEAFVFSSRSDPKLVARIRKQVDAAAKVTAKAVDDTTAKKKPPAGASVEQRNQWFDALIGRKLERAGYLRALTAQIAAYRDVKALLQARYDVTKDITRRASLEDQILSVQSQIDQDTAQLAKKREDAAGKRLAHEKAITKASAAAAAVRVAAINTAAVAQAKAINAAGPRLRGQRLAGEQRAQYRALGLTGTGEDRLPTPETLLARLRKLQGALRGTDQDTKANRTFLMGALGDLLGRHGNVTQATVAKINDFYTSVHDALDKGNKGTLKYFKHFSAEAIVNSLGGGLTGAQKRRLEVALSGIGPGLTAPTGRSTAYAAGIRPGVVIHEAHFHGVQNVAQLENEMEKRQRARAYRRRGAR